MSDTANLQGGANRRNQVMVGELPGDFLRFGTTQQQQQAMADERVAQILQAQQQAGYTVMPSNMRGRLSVTVVQGKLTKNYGITRMDPYCRLRVGHSVFETPTAYNGGKNPQWMKELHCNLPQGVENLYVEIFDEKSFTSDDRVAWAYITIPHASLNGETVDEWFPLSGRQGDEKEGMLNLVMSFVAVENLPPAMMSTVPMYMPQVYYPGVYPPAMPMGGVQPPMQTMPPMQQQPQGPMYTEDDFKQVKDMFPNMEDEVIKSVFVANSGNKNSTINSLLQMSVD